MGKKSKVPEVIVKPIEVAYNVTKTSGYVLDGVLTYREDLPQVGPIIVFAHGTLSDARHNFTDDLTQKLCKDFGFRSYRFNFRFDKSEHEPEHRYKFSGYEDDIDDLEAVIRALKVDGYIPWCLFGHSRGANDMLLYAERYGMMTPGGTGSVAGSPRTDYELNAQALAIVVAAPRFEMKNMSKKIFSEQQLHQLQSPEHHHQCVWSTQRGDLQVTAADLEVTDVKMDMGLVVRNIPIEVPILLLHGSDDELIPVADATMYRDQRPNTPGGTTGTTGSTIDVHVMEGARHAFRGKKIMKQFLTIVSDWLGAKYKEIQGKNIAGFQQYDAVASVSSSSSSSNNLGLSIQKDMSSISLASNSSASTVPCISSTGSFSGIPASESVISIDTIDITENPATTTTTTTTTKDAASTLLPLPLPPPSSPADPANADSVPNSVDPAATATTLDGKQGERELETNTNIGLDISM